MTTILTSQKSRSRLRLPAAVYLFFLGFYLLCMGGHFYSTDDASKLQVARSIVEQHTLAIDMVDGAFGMTGKDGRVYAWFPLGQSLVDVPFLLIGKACGLGFPAQDRWRVEKLAVSSINSFVTAGICLLLFLIAQRLGYGLRPSLGIALISGLCTILWPYAKYCWSEPLGVMFPLWALYLYCIRPASWQRLIAVGAVMGSAVLFRVEYAAGFILLACFHLWEFRKSPGSAVRGACMLFAGFIVPAGIQLWYNFHRWGDIFEFAKMQSPESASSATALPAYFFNGLDSIRSSVFSLGIHSLWVNSPVLIAGIIGAILIDRRNPVVRIMIVWAAAQFCFSVLYGSTSFALGNRYLYLCIPFIAFMALPILQSWAARPVILKILFLALCGLGFFANTATMLVNYHVVLEKIRGEQTEQEMVRRAKYNADCFPIVATCGLLPEQLKGTAHFLTAETPGGEDSRMWQRTNVFDLWVLNCAGHRGAQKLFAALFALLLIVLSAGSYRIIHENIVRDSCASEISG
jgi:hypothetical protein